MGTEFHDFHEGPIKQIIPAPAGWILAVPDRTEDDRLLVRVYPIMCWALIEQKGGPDLVQAVIDIADFGQAYVNDAVIVAPGQRVAEKLSKNIGISSFVIDAPEWNEEYLEAQGWLS